MTCFRLARDPLGKARRYLTVEGDRVSWQLNPRLALRFATYRDAEAYAGTIEGGWWVQPAPEVNTEYALQVLYEYEKLLEPGSGSLPERIDAMTEALRKVSAGKAFT
jgi:hypothetical protein